MDWEAPCTLCPGADDQRAGMETQRPELGAGVEGRLGAGETPPLPNESLPENLLHIDLWLLLHALTF